MSKKKIEKLEKWNEELQQEIVDLEQFIITLEESDEAGMMQLSPMDARYIRNKTMPKEMSDWFDEQIKGNEYAVVNGFGKKGYAMKSRDCTIIMVPNWNCDEQFSNIANDLRQKELPEGQERGFLEW